MNLTADPIPKLVRAITVPASMGMFFQTMYNNVDTYFAGKISVSALAALTFSFPVFFLVMAFGSGLGQASTALMANALGAGQKQQGRVIFCQSLLYALCLSLVLTTLGLILAPFLFRLQGAREDTLVLSLQYMNVIMVGSFFVLVQAVLNAELNARGNTKIARNALIAGFFANCVLDPWFMYGWAGVPAMGIAGLAWATIACQAGSCLYMFNHVRRGPLWSGMGKVDFVPNWPMLRQVTGQALPAIFNMLTVGVGIFVIQYFIGKYGEAPVAGYGIATRIEQMLLLPAMGLNYAVLSLVGQNNGAGRLDRVRETWLITLRYGLAMMVVGGVLLWFTRRWLMGVFTQDQEVIARGSEYLGIASVTLCSYVILFQTVVLLQGLKRPSFAIWIGMYRQIVAPLLFYNLLAVVLGWGLWGIWWGITLITWSAALMTLGYGRWVLSKARV